MDSDRVELWFWELKDELTGKWRKTRYRMTEEEARTRHGDNARKIEGTLEVRKSDPPIPRGLTAGRTHHWRIYLRDGMATEETQKWIRSGKGVF